MSGEATCPCCRQPVPGCMGCGQPLVQTGIGRPRKWCDRAACVRQRRRQKAQKPTVEQGREGRYA